MTPADPIPPPVTPEPLSDYQLDLLKRRLVEELATSPSEASVFDRLIAQARAARPSPWQPIAEHDGSDAEVLISDGVTVESGYWSNGHEAIIEGGVPVECDVPRGWFGTQTFAPHDRQPTHFQRMPAAPAQGRRTAAVNELPSIEEMAGSVSDVTGGQTLEEFMRRLRDE